MKFNGKQLPLLWPTNLLDFLKLQNIQVDRVAVELNGKIIPRESFFNTILKDSDTIEIVCFVGGG